MAEAAIKAVEEAGAEVKLFQIPETLPEEVREKMHAPKRREDIPDVTATDLKDYDGFIFSIPTRYGRAVSQVSAFFDTTGGLWSTQALSGKFATVFSSTGTQNGGQETTTLTTLPFFAHHGINYVPFGYINPGMMNGEEIKGGTPWGAGTIAGSNGSRQLSALELDLIKGHAKHFTDIVVQFKKGGDRIAKEKVVGGTAPVKGVSSTREANVSQNSSTSGTSSQKKKKRFSIDTVTKGFKKLLHPPSK